MRSNLKFMYCIQGILLLEIVMTGSTHRHSNPGMVSVSDEFDGESPPLVMCSHHQHF